MKFTTPYRSSRVLAGVSIAGAILLATAACSSGQETNAAGQTSGVKSGPITIALLQKQGDQQFFVDQAAGAKAAADKAGKVTLKVIDLKSDSNLAISQLDAMIAQKVDGILITVPDQQIGPQVISAAKAANIPLIALDDPIKDASGKEATFAGFDDHSMGAMAGDQTGPLYQAAGWNASDTRILSAYKPDLSVCVDRAKGSEDTFKKAIGSAEAPKTIVIGTDMSSPDAQNKAGAVITANPDVKHWIVWGCNDDNSTGVVTALQNSGVSPENIIGVGLGAYLACKDWKAGLTTGNKADVFVSGIQVGKTAADAMIGLLREGTPLPPKSIAKTFEVNAKNYKDVGMTCN